MDEFIDVILIILLVLIIGWLGLTTYLLLRYPMAGYWSIFALLAFIGGGVGVAGWRWARRRRLGAYYEMWQDLTLARKTLQRAINRAERPWRKVLRLQLPQIDKLCREARQRIDKIATIDRLLNTLHDSPAVSIPLQGVKGHSKIISSQQRSQTNLQEIQQSQAQYLQDVQQVSKFLHEMHTKVLALTYAHGDTNLQELTAMIDDVLIDIQTFEELS